MSLTQFESAIKGNMDAYSGTIKALRENEVFQRNNALGGLQTEMEKYGELAKIGLEIPMAVEGLKAVGGNVQNRVGAIKDFIQGRVGKLQQEVEERVPAIREGILRQIPRTRLNETRSKNDVELTETDDPGYFDNNNPSVNQNFPYGGEPRVSAQQPSSRNTGSPVSFEENTDDYGLPQTEPLGLGEPSLFSNEKSQLSTQRLLDTEFENDRTGIGNMGIANRRNIESKPKPFSKPEGPGEMKEMTDMSKPSEQGEMKIGSLDDKLVSPTLDSDIDAQADNLRVGALASSAAETGSTEEAIGAGLFSIPGIGEVLGGIMEGIGAITEATAVGAGAYGAVQSMISANQEETLREKPLAPIRIPTLDLGGSIGVPLMA